MRISIIVPALNEEESIAATLRNLQQLTGDKEIIVADGGSSDETRSIARREGAKVLTSPAGRGTQMRAGALEATGDVLWFVHADTLPPPHALDEIRAHLEDTSVAGGNFGLLFDGPSRAARQLTAIYPMLRILGLSYGDSGIFVRRDIYHRIGGFRHLALFEDLDLLRRLRRAGRFVHLSSRIITSSRRFENRNFALVWLHWTTLQVLYWCGVSPNWLARRYRHARRPKRER
jgi:rSAM/selenodomain-associated transferase 2